MDAVTYIKTYERMREAEGLKTFERLFNEEATPEQRVELVEEWGRENPETSDEEELPPPCILLPLCPVRRGVIKELVVRVIGVEQKIKALEEMMK